MKRERGRQEKREQDHHGERDHQEAKRQRGHHERPTPFRATRSHESSRTEGVQREEVAEVMTEEQSWERATADHVQQRLELCVAASPFPEHMREGARSIGQRQLYHPGSRLHALKGVDRQSAEQVRMLQRVQVVP